MKSILVTGGCGFIGSNFIRLALQRLPECRLVNLDKLTYAGNLNNLTDIENDAAKIKQELGWAPSVTFEEGIRSTIQWYLGNQKWVASVLDRPYQEYYDQMYSGRTK